MKNAINWFELPVQDLARARKFYETTLGGTFRAETMGPMEMVSFPHTSVGSVPTAIGATSAGDRLAATEEFVGSTTRSYRFFRMTPGDGSWTKLGEGVAPAVGRLWITSGGRIIGWLRGVGLVDLYRPGGPDAMSLYVDGSNRVWMAFQWGENVGSDVGYLFRAAGITERVCARSAGGTRGRGPEASRTPR